MIWAMTVSHLSVALFHAFRQSRIRIIPHLPNCGCKGTAFPANLQYLKMVIFIILMKGNYSAPIGMSSYITVVRQQV